MNLNVGKVITVLNRMTVSQLRQKYDEVFGEPTRCHNKDYLQRRIAWRMQALAEGDLSERARRRALELANDADLRMKAPPKSPPVSSECTAVGSLQTSLEKRLPMPGAIIIRKYKDQVHQVMVLPKGFDYQGEVYRSLSAVAKAITGTHWNGYDFFKLGKKGKIR